MLSKKWVFILILGVSVTSLVIASSYFFSSLRLAPLEPKDSLPKSVTVYAYGPSGLLSKQHGGEVAYYHTNSLSSSALVTDSEGMVVYRSDYEPFGSSLHASGEERYTYTGKEQDDSTGLYYYGARYYDSSLGRFISSDPVQGSVYSGQRLNRYTYVMNNPMVYTDPTGMEGEESNPYKLHRGGGIGLLAGGLRVLVGIGGSSVVAGSGVIGGSALATSALVNAATLTTIAGGIGEGLVGASPGTLVPLGVVVTAGRIISATPRGGVGTVVKTLNLIDDITPISLSTSSLDEAVGSQLARQIEEINVRPGIESGRWAGRHSNCVACTDAFINTVSGNPTSALPGLTGTAADPMGRAAMWKPQFFGSIDELTTELTQLGPGASASVRVSSRTYGDVPGIRHNIGAVNVGGRVSFIDSQYADVVYPSEIYGALIYPPK